MEKQSLIPTEMKLKQARHTSYNTSHLCKHQRQQGDGMTLSYLGRLSPSFACLHACLAYLLTYLHKCIALPCCILSSHALVALHCACIASPFEVSHDRGRSPLVWLCALHYIWNEKMHNLVSWAITHWNARLMVREPRTMSLWVINMIRDIVGAYIAWIALPCKALSSAAVKQILQELFADRLHIVPTGNPSMADSFINSRWSHLTAGGHSPQPVVPPNVRGSNSETLEVFRGAEQGKYRQFAHGSGLPSKSPARVHWALFPRPPFSCFLKLINWFN